MFQQVVISVVLATAAVGTGIFFPTYFPPEQDCARWARISSAIAAHPDLTVYTVTRGPFPLWEAPDENWRACIPTLQPAGTPSKNLAYMSTLNGRRPFSVLEPEIDDYASWDPSFRPKGILFDEAGTTADLVAYYEHLADYARSKGFEFVALNPGATTDAGYYAFSDLIITRVDHLVKFIPAQLSISSATPAEKQGITIHSAFGFIGDVSNFIVQLSGLGLGTVFFTDDVVNEPWDQIPSYWEDEVALVASLA